MLYQAELLPDRGGAYTRAYTLKQGARRIAFTRHPLEPVADERTRVLLLGTLPSQASLAARQYYAHPQNHFWRLAGTVIDVPELAALPYGERLDMLLAAGVGLWDTVASAVRPGSLDAAMRSVEPTDLPALVARLPALTAVGFNGATAARLGARALASFSYLALVPLPSSSPAYTLPFIEKRARWLTLRHYLS